MRLVVCGIAKGDIDLVTRTRSKQSENNKHQQQERTRRSAAAAAQMCSGSKSDSACCLSSLKVNLTDVGWHFILSPEVSNRFWTKSKKLNLHISYISLLHIKYILKTVLVMLPLPLLLVMLVLNPIFFPLSPRLRS